MGAQEFCVTATGKTAQDAFNNAVTDAQWEYGHGGYTGTIAEKSSFVMVKLPEGKEADEYVEELMALDDGESAMKAVEDTFRDKWGPAGCIDLGHCDIPKSNLRRFLFFGNASS